MNKLEDKIWDVVVVGGGASGMMAAGRAAECGAKVLLLEKNESLGKKLLITGGGRCNITNNEPDVRKFLSKFKDSDKFLFSAFSQFAVKESLDFFHNFKMETKEEALGRVFPLSNSAKSVWDTLLQYLKQGKVTVQSKAEVVGLQPLKASSGRMTKTRDNKITSAILKNKTELRAKSFILATGGKSRPETGSTGDGFKWLKEIGHNITEPAASLVPIKIKEEWVKKLQGVGVTNVKLTVLQNDEKQSVKKGKILFTHFGLSGPTVLNLSNEIGELLKYGEVLISLDILPNFDHGQLNQKLQDIFKEKTNKKFKNTLDSLMPSALVPIIVELSKIDGDKQSNSITREERLQLIEVLKNIKIEVDSLLGVEKAITTSGGVSLDEVDFKTMQSRLFPNLYLVGDILNIDRPSGGYSLQLCWTTGFVAGSNAGQVK
ncbi:MAG: aminoacetone oxidase family FAD-binding enzyme [Candidatus Zambryskibacteria bacterium]|nr:aminoacetone oxidase family FAD-binding enzyme [Candidatus Zambryskibacteria bacterium]